MAQEFTELWDYLERKPGAGPEGHAPESTEATEAPSEGAEPELRLARQDGRVRVIGVRCACGREFDIECIYPDDSPEPGGETES